MEDKKCYEQLSKPDLENLLNTSLEIKDKLKVGVSKINKDLEDNFTEDLTLPDKSFGEFVRLMNIKVNLTNLLNELDTSINNYIKLEKTIFNKSN